MDIPKDKDHPADAVQCDGCGGFGCPDCEDRGWFQGLSHPLGRRCARTDCGQSLPPFHVAVYCSNACALDDADPIDLVPFDDDHRNGARS